MCLIKKKKEKKKAEKIATNPWTWNLYIDVGLFPKPLWKHVICGQSLVQNFNLGGNMNVSSC